MYNILDLLYEYSKKGKRADSTFIYQATNIIKEQKKLENYIKKVIHNKNLTIQKNDDGSNLISPIAYDVYERKIEFSLENINFFYNEIKEDLQNSNFSDFEKILYYNSMILFALLHEIEHANQNKKISEDNKNFEKLLLSIVFYVPIEILKKFKINTTITILKLILFNDKLINDINLLNEFYEQNYHISPAERLASIYGLREIILILNKIKSEIPNVIDEFKVSLNSMYLKGYNYEQSIPYPTERYLESFKKLNISKFDIYLNKDFEILKAESKKGSLEERLTLGLAITEEEYNQIKKLSMNNSKFNFDF